ncbi:hypothetical protein KUCAC02_022287, partial [Chaenocephalus aceratus]
RKSAGPSNNPSYLLWELQLSREGRCLEEWREGGNLHDRDYVVPFRLPGEHRVIKPKAHSMGDR